MENFSKISYNLIYIIFLHGSDQNIAYKFNLKNGTFL